LTVPGATAFTQTPRLAYWIASDLVAAFRPPFRQGREHARYADIEEQLQTGFS
jgi:hypothetical protein